MENNDTGCRVKSCLCKLICFALPVFIFLFLAGYVVHHIWLMPIYRQTAALWRPADQMKEFFPWMIGYYAVLAILISALFCKAKKAKLAACGTAGETDRSIGGKNCPIKFGPIKFGVCFGIIVGLLIGVVNAAAWIFQPIPGELAIKWLIAWLVEGILIGIILALICHCKQKKCSANK